MESLLNSFETTFKDIAPAFFREYTRTQEREPELLARVAEPMLEWAKSGLGNGYEERLIEGYCTFVMDVNRQQKLYEKRREYANKSFAEVFAVAYSDKEFMDLYHWGVYLSTFVWLHHLRIYKFFEMNFLPLIGTRRDRAQLLDLGAGSGIWHLLALEKLSSWDVTAVDISAPSIELSKKMASASSYSNRIEHVCADATQWRPQLPHDAGISCFVLEHLEAPRELLNGLAESLHEGAYAFVTGALTAAEVDHIFEFKRESELVSLAESCGFRVTHAYSAEPETTPKDRYYLPRSMAMILQKRHNPIW